MPRRSAPKVIPPSDEVIVERELELWKGRKQTRVVVRFGKPVPDDRCFRCGFRIAGLGAKPIAGHGYGEDGVQALELAMQSSSIQLLSSREYRGGRLTFFGSRNLRLPLPGDMSYLSGPDRSAGADRTVFADRSVRTFTRSVDAPVLVERELELRKGRKRTKVVVRFRQPVLHPYGFACAFQIEGLLARPPSRSGMLGMDGVDALRNAMQLAMVYILSSRAYRRGQLTWLGVFFDLGLPVHDEIAPLIRRDLQAARFAREMMVHPAKRAAQERKHLLENPDLLRSHNDMIAELNRTTGSKLPLLAPRKSKQPIPRTKRRKRNQPRPFRASAG